MLKKVLTTAVLGVSALSVIAANAALPGVYITGQLGYAKTGMRDKTNLSDMARQSGLSVTTSSTDNLSNDGLAGRAAIGIRVTPNLAFEAGYLQLGRKKVKAPFTYKDGDIVKDFSGSFSLSQNAIDLLAVGILPLSNGLSLIGKVGAAYLTTNLAMTFDLPVASATIPTPGVIQVPATVNPNSTIARHKIVPEAVIGVRYNIASNVFVDASWTHIHPFGKNRPGNINFVSAGLGYDFG
jgi:opacity protein-like surface antigen